jgi:outer membrane receptor protein involved in Fe transport
MAGNAQDQSHQDQSQIDLTQMQLEDLMNIKVTSVSKKEQTLSRTAAAVFVITPEDIRRSGATSIPDLLRMAPGVDVQQIDANSWAISIRGFNSRYSNKLLVLVDGRTVYTPSFSGVFWEHLEMPLENIERIEVIRGPGATVWGANAVNGVISILTKSSKDTQGGLITAGGGSQSADGVAQYGGTAGSAGHSRRCEYSSVNNSAMADGAAANDRWTGAPGASAPIGTSQSAIQSRCRAISSRTNRTRRSEILSSRALNAHSSKESMPPQRPDHAVGTIPCGWTRRLCRLILTTTAARMRECPRCRRP